MCTKGSPTSSSTVRSSSISPPSKTRLISLSSFFARSLTILGKRLNIVSIGTNLTDMTSSCKSFETLFRPVRTSSRTSNLCLFASWRRRILHITSSSTRFINESSRSMPTRTLWTFFTAALVFPDFEFLFLSSCCCVRDKSVTNGFTSTFTTSETLFTASSSLLASSFVETTSLNSKSNFSFSISSTDGSVSIIVPSSEILRIATAERADFRIHDSWSVIVILKVLVPPSCTIWMLMSFSSLVS